MNFAAFLTLLLMVATPLTAKAQPAPLKGTAAPGSAMTHSAPANPTAPNPMPGATRNAAQGAAVTAPGVENAGMAPTGVPMLAPARALPTNDLRSTLQFQNARLHESAQSDRHLNAQERAALRQLLRQQREGGPGSPAAH